MIRPLCLACLAAVFGCGQGKSDCDWFPDGDGDGFGDGLADPICAPDDPSGLAHNALDCDDDDAEVNPEADERCDDAGADEDCDGLVNDADQAPRNTLNTWPDADGDTHGDPTGEVVRLCVVPPGRSASGADCDDSAPATFPGAAFVESATACMADADGDGWGASHPPPGVEAGSDCDDNVPTIYPDAAERFGDGRDQDCDGDDLWVLFDGFELGEPDPGVWSGLVGPPGIIEGHTHEGQYALVSGEGSLTTRALDASECGSLSWSLWLDRESVSAEATSVKLQFYDGSSWVDVATLDQLTDTESFRPYGGLITDPAALHSALMVRVLVEVEYSSGWAYLDDFRLACPGPDTDGDGVGERDDCDEADARHWSDCGLCVDSDGDAHGDRCDLGQDCDDQDADAFPGNPDLQTDGVDNDCNGFDGIGWFDDFDGDLPDPLVWSTITGDHGFDDLRFYSGQYALRLGETSSAISQPLDASSCTHLYWSLWALRGPDTPEVGDDLVLLYDDGTDWVPAGAVEGNGSADGGFAHWFGMIDDPAAMWSGLRFQLQTAGGNGLGLDGDDFYLDDLLVACSEPDADGDGRPGDRDCDDAAPAHWSDCGSCVDADGDGYGLDCDRGSDCDDSDASFHPQAADLYGDARDTNCDGFDGRALLEDFERGYPDPGLWDALFETEITDRHASSGDFSLLINQEDYVETRSFDTSDCPALYWSYRGMRGTPPPATDEGLLLAYFNGTGWVTFDLWEGSGARDDAWSQRQGLIDAPGALRPDLRLLMGTAGDIATSRYYIDDVTLVCSEKDLDGDGFVGVLDCDNAAPEHWSDCGRCVDVDGDSYGADCDRGPDCDDSNAEHRPLVPDPDGDGIDADCSGLDGPGLADAFEAGVREPGVWASMEGAVAFDTQWAHSGQYSLMMTGTSTLETVPRDTSACGKLIWSYFAVPLYLDSGEALILSWWDGASWVELDQLTGGGADFVLRSGELTDPAASSSDFRVRFQLNVDDEAWHDAVYLDDVTLDCL